MKTPSTPVTTASTTAGSSNINKINSNSNSNNSKNNTAMLSVPRAVPVTPENVSMDSLLSVTPFQHDDNNMDDVVTNLFASSSPVAVASSATRTTTTPARKLPYAYDPGPVATEDLTLFLNAFQPFVIVNDDKTTTASTGLLLLTDNDAATIESFARDALIARHGAVQGLRLATFFQPAIDRTVRKLQPQAATASTGMTTTTTRATTTRATTTTTTSRRRNKALIASKLCAYAGMWDSLCRFDGGVSDKSGASSGDSAIQLAEWIYGYRILVRGSLFEGLQKIKNETEARAVFDKMSGGDGKIDYDEWCDYLETIEVQRQTDLGMLFDGRAEEKEQIRIDQKKQQEQRRRLQQAEVERQIKEEDQQANTVLPEEEAEAKPGNAENVSRLGKLVDDAHASDDFKLFVAALEPFRQSLDTFSYRSVHSFTQHALMIKHEPEMAGRLYDVFQPAIQRASLQVDISNNAQETMVAGRLVACAAMLDTLHRLDGGMSDRSAFTGDAKIQLAEWIYGYRLLLRNGCYFRGLELVDSDEQARLLFAKIAGPDDSINYDRWCTFLERMEQEKGTNFGPFFPARGMDNIVSSDESKTTSTTETTKELLVTSSSTPFTIQNTDPFQQQKTVGPYNPDDFTLFVTALKPLAQASTPQPYSAQDVTALVWEALVTSGHGLDVAEHLIQIFQPAIDRASRQFDGPEKRPAWSSAVVASRLCAYAFMVHVLYRLNDQSGKNGSNVHDIQIPYKEWITGYHILNVKTLDDATRFFKTIAGNNDDCITFDKWCTSIESTDEMQQHQQQERQKSNDKLDESLTAFGPDVAASGDLRLFLAAFAPFVALTDPPPACGAKQFAAQSLIHFHGSVEGVRLLQRFERAIQRTCQKEYSTMGALSSNLCAYAGMLDTLRRFHSSTTSDKVERTGKVSIQLQEWIYGYRMLVRDSLFKGLQIKDEKDAEHVFRQMANDDNSNEVSYDSFCSYLEKIEVEKTTGLGMLFGKDADERALRKCNISKEDWTAGETRNREASQQTLEEELQQSESHVEIATSDEDKVLAEREEGHLLLNSQDTTNTEEKRLLAKGRVIWKDEEELLRLTVETTAKDAQAKAEAQALFREAERRLLLEAEEQAQARNNALAEEEAKKKDIEEKALADQEKRRRIEDDELRHRIEQEERARVKAETLERDSEWIPLVPSPPFVYEPGSSASDDLRLFVLAFKPFTTSTAPPPVITIEAFALETLLSAFGPIDGFRISEVFALSIERTSKMFHATTGIVAAKLCAYAGMLETYRRIAGKNGSGELSVGLSEWVHGYHMLQDTGFVGLKINDQAQAQGVFAAISGTGAITFEKFCDFLEAMEMKEKSDLSMLFDGRADEDAIDDMKEERKAEHTAEAKRLKADARSKIKLKEQRMAKAQSARAILEQKERYKEASTKAAREARSIIEMESRARAEKARAEREARTRSSPILNLGPIHFCFSPVSKSSIASSISSLGHNLYQGRSPAARARLRPDLKWDPEQKCTERWHLDLHPRPGGCHRCLYFASEEEKEKFFAVGHHHRVNMTRGGCPRNCPYFPRSQHEAPVRLCHKCFYDTHELVLW